MVLGMPLHVHEADRAAGLGDHVGHLVVVAQRAHVVDDGRAGGERAAGDLRLHRVDRDGDADAAGERLDHRQHAAQLLVQGDQLGARPRGLAADVDDRRALTHQREGLLERGVGGEELPPSENESGVTLTTPMMAGNCRSSAKVGAAGSMAGSVSAAR